MYGYNVGDAMEEAPPGDVWIVDDYLCPFCEEAGREPRHYVATHLVNGRIEGVLSEHACKKRHPEVPLASGYKLSFVRNLGMLAALGEIGPLAMNPEGGTPKIAEHRPVVIDITGEPSDE